MIKSLYIISERYRDKKIIVYGINRTAICIFARLALNHQVNVYGFWDIDDKFTGERLINRPIINTVQIERMEDVTVIIPEAHKKQEMEKWLKKGIEVIYLDDLLGLNEELRNKKIYIYGIGNWGETIYDALKDARIDIEGVCVTTPARIEKWCGKEVLSVEQIEQGKNFAVILATDIERNQKEMLKKIEHLKLEKYVLYFMDEEVISETNFFQVINIALQKHKQIWLYGCEDEHTQYLREVLEKYQIEITNGICNENIYDLKDKEIDDISVVIAESDAVITEQVCDILDSMGFSLERWDYAAIRDYISKASYRARVGRDLLIGYSTLVDKRYPGYVVYGDEKSANVRIMMLGNSTSTDGIYRSVSWVELLYKEMCKAGYDPVIYNGAVSGHGVVDEFLHMVRDIEPLKPDYVVSMSGINNTESRKVPNLFNTRSAEFAIDKNCESICGIEANETNYDFWCRIQKMMALIATQHGAKMYSFLQPMGSGEKNDLDLIEYTMFDCTEHAYNIKNFRDRASQEENVFYTNLISIFEKGNHNYIDFCHYTVEGSRKLALCVFETMEQDIKKFVQNRGK